MDFRLSGRSRYDFAVYDREGRLSALLEVKRQFGTDVSWSRAWHDSAIESMKPPAEAYVMLITPDRIYAWRPGREASSNPDWSLDAEPLLGPYFKRLQIPSREVAGSVFESIVGLWLQDIAEGEPKALESGSEAESLLSALRGGEVVGQVAA